MHMVINVDDIYCCRMRLKLGVNPNTSSNNKCLDLKSYILVLYILFLRYSEDFKSSGLEKNWKIQNI